MHAAWLHCRWRKAGTIASTAAQIGCTLKLGAACPVHLLGPICKRQNRCPGMALRACSFPRASPCSCSCSPTGEAMVVAQAVTLLASDVVVLAAAWVAATLECHRARPPFLGSRCLATGGPWGSMRLHSRYGYADNLHTHRAHEHVNALAPPAHNAQGRCFGAVLARTDLCLGTVPGAMTRHTPTRVLLACWRFHHRRAAHHGRCSVTGGW